MKTDFSLKTYKDQTFLKNPQALHENYVPDNILFRQEELNFLGANFFARGLFNGIPENLFIYGKPATAKTLCVNYYKKEFDDEVLAKGLKKRVVYVNCKGNPNPKKFATAILQNILEFQDVKKLVKGTGVDYNSGHDLFKVFLKEIEGRYDTVLLIIDEVEKLDDKNFLDDILYMLSRAKGIETNYILKNCTIAVCLISNDEGVSDSLSVGTRSSLNLRLKRFEEYHIPQMKDILEERCRQALKEGTYDFETIQTLLNISRDEHQIDIRDSLHILRVAVQLAETKGSSKIEKEHIKTAYESFFSEEMEAKANRYDLHIKIIALALGSIQLSQSSKEEDSTKCSFKFQPIYTTYTELCKRFCVTPKSYSQIFKDLQNISKEKDEIFERHDISRKNIEYILKNEGLQLLHIFKKHVERDAFGEELKQHRIQENVIKRLRDDL